MTSVASSASMDLTAVVPALMQGIAQEVGVDLNELKVILVGDETQVDLEPFQTLKEQHDQVEWDSKKLHQHLDQHNSPTPYIEIALKRDVAFFQPFNTTSSVKGAPRLHEVRKFHGGTHGSCCVSRSFLPISIADRDFFVYPHLGILDTPDSIGWTVF